MLRGKYQVRGGGGGRGDASVHLFYPSRATGVKPLPPSPIMITHLVNTMGEVHTDKYRVNSICLLANRFIVGGIFSFGKSPPTEHWLGNMTH